MSDTDKPVRCPRCHGYHQSATAPAIEETPEQFGDRIANEVLIPLYVERYRALDIACSGALLWQRILIVKAELVTIERKAQEMRKKGNGKA